jgi:hypothetical protein
MMRVLAMVALIVVLVIAGFAAWWLSQTPTYTYRFRLVIEAEVDGALRSGASVIEVRTTDFKVGLPETKGLRSSVRGEAVFVDLGNGRNLIATLGFGPDGSEDKIARLALLAFLPSHPRLEVGDVPNLTGEAPLTGNLIPTLVTFADVNVPKTARVVRPGEFEQVLGRGVRFKRAFIEMVPAGSWPFSMLGWPRDLAGVSVTREIESKLPWWNGPGRPASEARRAWLAGQSFGPSVEPETLFRRN